MPELTSLGSKLTRLHITEVIHSKTIDFRPSKFDSKLNAYRRGGQILINNPYKDNTVLKPIKNDSFEK